MEGEKKKNMNLLSNLLKKIFIFIFIIIVMTSSCKKNVKDSRVVSYLGTNHKAFVILKGTKA